MIVKEVNSFLAITFEISKHCPTVENYWRILLPQLQPYKYLEIGSFEGLSTSRFLEIAKTYSLQNTSHRLQVTCIDSWSGGEEHQGMNFGKIKCPRVSQLVPSREKTRDQKNKIFESPSTLQTGWQRKQSV
jgi:hypothetical protein